MTRKFDIEALEDTTDDSLFEIALMEDDTVIDIYLSDEIKSGHKYVNLYAQLRVADKDDKVNIFLACSGGCVAAAQRICYAIRRCEGYVTIYLDSPSMSAGSLIALSGNKLVFAKDAYLMFHGGSAGISGNLSHAKEGLAVTHKWCYGNDLEWASPFLTDKEIKSINTSSKEIHIFGTDDDLQDRMDRHFK